MFLKLLQPVYPLELVAYSGSEEVVQFRAKKKPYNRSNGCCNSGVFSPRPLPLLQGSRFITANKL